MHPNATHVLTGNLTKIAQTLASMRRCLAVVGNVPEFAGGKQKLVVLEDRLESMVLPQLTDALKARNIEMVCARNTFAASIYLTFDFRFVSPFALTN